MNRRPGPLAAVAAVMLFASPGAAATAADGPEAACEAYRIAGVGLGMNSDEVRVMLGALGTPAVALDGSGGAALVFDVDATRVEVEFDRRPRRRRPGLVTGVRSSRDEQSAGAQSLLEAFVRRVGPPDDRATGDAGDGSGVTRLRWASTECGATLELAIEEQVEWWQPRARSVIVRIEPLDEVSR